MAFASLPDRRRPVAAPPLSERRLDRRALLLGAGTLAVGAASAGTGAGAPGGGGPPSRVPGLAPTPVRASPAASPPASPIGPAGSPAAGLAEINVIRGKPKSDPPVPAGMALITSPRLPLFGVGPDDVSRLLRGEIDDWRRLGTAPSLPVRPLAIRGAAAPGANPVASVADYAALLAELDRLPGGVALVPLEDVDFRVNVLSVGLDDPLRDPGSGGAPLVRIGVVGDIVPGRNVHAHMVKYDDFTRPFRKVAPLLSGFDLTFANLEGNLSSTLPQPSNPHSVSFVSDPAMTDGLGLAGIDVVTLANNHTVYNEEGWGSQGLLDTIAALDAAGIPYVGAGRSLADARAPWTTTVNGTSIAFLGVDGVTANQDLAPASDNGVLQADAAATADQPGTNPFLGPQVLADIAAAAEQADIVIPYFHMGREYVAVPPAWVVAGARAAIDAGATLVVTLHPHVIQGMEIYAGRPIVYSPGNFVFDQMFSAEVRSGFVLDLTLRADRVVALRCHGVEIEDFHQPRPMTAGEQAGLMDRFWASTDRLAARDADS